MKLRTLAAAAVLSLTLACQAQAADFHLTPAANLIGVTPVLELHLTPPTNWTPAFTRQVEQAIVQQVQTELEPVWHTSGITFGPEGVPINFITEKAMGATFYCAPRSLGCHYDLPDGTLAIYVANGPVGVETETLDHEILETLVDPYGFYAPTMTGDYVDEICDPVENNPARVDGVRLSRFVHPGYFHRLNAIALPTVNITLG